MYLRAPPTAVSGVGDLAMIGTPEAFRSAWRRLQAKMPRRDRAICLPRPRAKVGRSEHSVTGAPRCGGHVQFRRFLRRDSLGHRIPLMV